jgi:type II secretion system protein N
MILADRHKRWLKRLGYPALAIVSFLLALYYTFPYHRLKDRLAAGLSSDFEVTIDSIGPGFIPGHIVIKGLALKTRPAKDVDKPQVFSADEITVNVGLLALLGGDVDVTIDADVGEGTIWGRYVEEDGATTVTIRTEDLPLETVPGVASATGGVPIAGGLNAEIRLSLPKNKWKDAQGRIEMSCKSCTIGDGQSKIRPMAPGQSNAFSDQGLTLPKLRLGQIGGRVDIKKGVGTFEKFQAKSPDGELYLEGEIRFADPFAQSQVMAYMRFKSSDELRARESRMADMELMMSANSRRADGYHGLRITGPVGQLRYIPSKLNPVTKETARGALGGVSANVPPRPFVRPAVPPPVPVPDDVGVLPSPPVETASAPPPPDMPRPSSIPAMPIPIDERSMDRVPPGEVMHMDPPPVHPPPVYDEPPRVEEPPHPVYPGNEDPPPPPPPDPDSPYRPNIE